MHCYRKKTLVFTTIAVCSLFFVTSCKKYEEPKPTSENSIDYALQVIPDIHNWAKGDQFDATDLVEAMNSIPATINGQQTTISALHFGDNPPVLSKIQNDGSLLGFITQGKVVGVNPPPQNTPKIAYMQSKKYIPYGPSFPAVEEGNYDIRCYHFRFHDQHRGIAQCDYKSVYIDEGPDNYLYEIAHTTDPVFIMGEGDAFTAYYYITTEKKMSTFFSSITTDNGPHMAVILSGRVSDNGIYDVYYGYKVLSYKNPPVSDPYLPPMVANVNDIIILSPLIDTVPFSYWDPNFSY